MIQPEYSEVTSLTLFKITVNDQYRLIPEIFLKLMALITLLTFAFLDILTMLNTHEETSRIVEIAWEDREPFEAIEAQYGLNETAVIIFMRKRPQQRSFKRWRKRVSGRKTKHLKIRSPFVSRAHCSTQYKLRPSKILQRRKG